ncbi:mucoidy inhibitor MuiA family protein [Sunxiuqinia sp. sy24]|uniref:mucoidy inhibitor MuiA family protein n=1 Tax=Sunxiuqinia sp. sy24 TaxID=3461495 RepID=UPI004045A0D8
MKTISILCLSIILNNLFAPKIDEKEIETNVSEVTVFIEGAQITRKKTIELPQGTTVLKFNNLSPFIDAKSIQAKANGDVTILSVNHQQNFLEELEKTAEVKTIESKIKDITAQIELEKTHLSILDEEFIFLKDNRVIGGKNNGLSVVNFKETSEYYRTQLSNLMFKKNERNKTIEELNKQLANLEHQLSTISSKKDFPMGEILVKVQAETKTSASIEISYLVENTGWYPSYDIRAKSINDPVEIIYKANVRQDTKTDWENVKLKFSSSNPNSSGTAPELKTYYLDYNNYPPVYNKSINSVNGQVTDQDSQPLPGATVMVPETTIGAVTDINGNYSITVPTNSDYLSFSFIGFRTRTIPITGSVINVKMEEDVLALEEVVTVAYGIQGNADNALSGRAAGVSVRTDSKMRSRDSESIAVPFQKTENQTSVDFEIKTPYSIKSDNKSYSVDMAVYQVPALYQYYSVPKISRDAFLIANFTNWEKYSLLEGEANIFFEDTYIGKSLIDVRFATDTLQISLGKDKNVNVSRENQKDYTTRQFIGSKKEEIKSWHITVKNNKSQEINMIIYDQVPVSKREEIEVVIQNLSEGNQNKENGEVKWEFSLKPMEKKEFDLKYSVKYPKYKNLIIE